MTARTLMVLGTASSVGKSLITAALCRIYARRGFRVAPFKAQNMALNSFVTPGGHEIGRAQAVQAEAAGCPPSVHMNPILLKPEAGSRCQVVVSGKPVGGMTAADYHAYKPELRRTIKEALAVLRADNDVVFMEGAGSPVEINLKANDIVNMFVAELADAPVVLVGDIDRGGVFASLFGTMQLLEPRERGRVAGHIINKFRGDLALLGDGLEQLRELTGVPVLGVVPHIERLAIAEEDSTGLARRVGQRPAPTDDDSIDVAVIALPHISNYDDVLPLEREPGVRVWFARSADGIEDADLVVLPGSKSTASDLAWLRAERIDGAIVRRARSGRPVLGICGGCQMLGERILDPERVESDTPLVPGLGLLPLTTRYRATKTTSQVSATTVAPSFLSADGAIVGYEIHMGETERRPGARAAFELRRRGDDQPRADGAVSDNGAVVGTMIHGVLDNAAVRSALLRYLRPHSTRFARSAIARFQDEYDRLADAVEQSLSMEALDRIIGVDGSRR